MTAPGDVFAQNVRLWPDAKTGPYLVRLTFATIGGRLEVVGIEMWGQNPPTDEKWTRWEEHQQAPGDTPQPITSVSVRMPLDRMAREALRRLEAASALISAKPERFSEKARASAEQAPALQPPQSGRPPVYDEEHWAAVASTYSRALAARERPTLAVGQKFNVSKSTAANWVARCRELGLLPPASKGRAVGRTAQDTDAGE